MNIQLNLSKDFERCLDDLRKKYGEDFEYINGIHPSQLDCSEFINKFVDTGTVADASIDPNANVSQKDIRTFISEKDKSENKLFGLNKIFYEIKKEWGLRTAKQWLEQEFSRGFYLNDSTTASFFPYCWAQDLTRLATEGLFFLKGYNYQAPKHLTTFFDDVIEFVSFLSNRQSGAVGLPNILIWAWWFWKKDVENGYYMKDPDYYLRQNFQKLIYRLNQPFLRTDQSAFTNISIFDRPYLEALFGGTEFPDGTLAIDHIEDLIQCQKEFMEVVSEIRDTQMFTYPVLTYSLLYKDGKFVDEPFARWCSDHNIRWSDSNFFVSDNVGTLSNCPMSGGTPVLYWNTAVNTWDTAAIGGLYYAKAPHETITVLSNGQKRQCRIRQFHEPWTYEIELANGAVIRTTSEHLNKVYSGDYVATKELTVNDYLPYTTVAYMGTQHMSYEKGKVIGIYLGAGSYYNPNTVTFHLDRSTQNACINFLKNYCKEHFNAILSYDDCDESNYVDMRVRSRSLKALLADFICHMDTPDQWINNAVIEQSIEFRQGIMDGLYAISGEYNNRVYIHSLSLRDSLVTMLASMGIVAFVTRDDQNGQTESDDTETGYIVRWYTSGMHHIVKNKYIIDPERQCFWVRIQRIVRNANPDADNDKGNTASYCLEMADDEEPVFMLANGIHTHNCRLLSDTTKLDAFINSIGGTALSVGSCRVSTINLVRIAYESGLDQKKYLKILRERATLDCKALYSMRHIIKRNIEKGLLPNYTEGGVELAKQYCTMGILGLYEVIDMFGMIRTDEAGNKSYSEEGVRFASEILDVLNDVKDHFTTEFSINMESIPAENCAGVICQADNLLYEQNRYFIYSNQWIPLTEKCTIQEKCRLGSLFDKKCGGGCICHINIENRFPDAETAWDMLNYVASHGVIYFSFTTKISVCESRHSFIGTATCPRCGKPVADTYARVVGFYVPVSKYQSIRRKEFDKRRWYDVLQKDSMFT